ncbi:tripartite tricarboxylate transporter TctB family protein [Rhodoplanes azumiensis]|uniref:Tripartite tricarboxylate transporter TctB family protein n=1 Tax=Rhodoplanes azumiensis TaxID=1897628 RepID=A0ABW5AIM2_9BRAD
MSGAPDRGATPAAASSGPARSRLSVVAEAVLIAGAALAAVVWIIPAQTSDGGIGLSPAVFPTVCAIALGLFVVADALLRLLRATPGDPYPDGWGACLRIGAVAVLGAAVLPVVGIAGCALVMVPAGMLVLGERRPLRIAVAALACVGLVWLVFR